jgi:hypothetical protein
MTKLMLTNPDFDFDAYLANGGKLLDLVMPDELIDFDGPYWTRTFSRPKWANRPPPGIPSDRWKKRLRSTSELAAFRAGVER